MARNTSISLSPYFTGMIDRLVEGGQYGSASEVVRAALRLLATQEQRHEALRQALIQGEESGPAGELDMAEIKRKALQRALVEGEESGPATPFDMDEWLAEKRGDKD